MLTIHLQRPNLSSYAGCNHCHSALFVYIVPQKIRGYESPLTIISVRGGRTQFLICSTLMFSNCSMILLWEGHEKQIKKIFFQSIPCVESFPFFVAVLSQTSPYVLGSTHEVFVFLLFFFWSHHFSGK